MMAIEKELPEGWEWKTLDDILTLLQNGISDKQNTDKLGYPVSRIETIQNSEIDPKRIKYVPADDEKFEKYRYRKGDILFSHINSVEKIGKVAIFNEQIKELIHGVNLLRLSFDKTIYPRFAYYYFQSGICRREYEFHIKKAINQASINQTNLKSIHFPVPPLEEQKRIVAKLDAVFGRIDSSIEKLNEDFEHVDELIRSYTKSCIARRDNLPEGWKEQEIGSVISLEYGKPLPKEDRDSGGAFPVYGANGEKTRSNKFYHSKPTIIIGRKGSAGELNLTEEKFWPLDVAYFVTFDENLYDMKYIYYVLQTLNLKTLAKGVKPGINRNHVYALKSSFPSLEEQKNIATKLDSMFGKREQLQTMLENLQLYNLKSSILDAAFRGKL